MFCMMYDVPVLYDVCCSFQRVAMFDALWYVINVCGRAVKSEK